MEKVFIEKLISLTGVSKEYAQAQWFTLTDEERKKPVKAAEIISKKFGKEEEEEEGVCPKCGGIQLDYGAMDYNGESIYYPYSCPECGIEGKEWFSMTFVQHTIDK